MKVASYCRVSTDKDDQANSFETQQRYFREYIERHSDWELYDVYADEGITGTSTKKRTHFKRMVADAYEGKFQLIVTKEVSRFSRNILDTILYTRELKAIGVAVLFVTDGINTMDPDAELRLSIMASIAQEESRRTSSRVTWGQTRQMEKGIVFGPSLLGYDVKNGKITIRPDDAETVRLIFQKYAVEQAGTTQIARYLSSKGFRTHKGSTKWRSGTIIKILKNEKYVGDLIQKKSYTPDFLTHEKRRNNGEVPLIHIHNHHEPIISRELWDLAQKRLKQNNKHRSRDCSGSALHIFSGKIKCGECGANFVVRYKYCQDGTKIRRWSCSAAAGSGATACDVGKLVRDDDAMEMLKTAVCTLSLDTNAIIHNVTILALDAIQAGVQEAIERPDLLLRQIDQTLRKKETMMDSYFSGDITKDDMLSWKCKYDRILDDLHAQLSNAVQQNAEENELQIKSTIQSELAALLSSETVSEVFFKTILDSITVFKDRHLELRLKFLPQVFRFTG